MSSIDNRVVKMEMDNGQFENNARTSISTLDKLKSALKLNKATDGLDKVDKKMKEGLSTQDLSSKVGSLADRFSVMGTVAMGVMSNIATRAVYAGSQVIKSFTLGPIIQGFQEYETQMNAIQTIMANTASKGTTLKEVTAALDELNTYADKTIYNFTEMTRNIGTFTAAGVDLKLATSSIKGIANLAAVSGSNSQQASTAMYQLSQAIATGSVRLMDWNSVVNAGMGGEVFQKALIRTSNNLKTGADAAIKAKGSFRDSLKEGWLTSEVLTETLKQFQLSVDTAEDYNNAIKSLVAQGYTQEEAKQIADMAKTAGDAATKVKTFTQLIDTLKEAIGSGWSKTFQILLGDFEEARNSWTSISETLGDLISASSDARNEMLQGWSDLGGRKELFGTLADSIKMVVSWMDPLKKGFRDVFPPVTAKRLFELTQGFHDFIKGLTLSDKNSKKLRKTISNLVSPFKLVTKVLGTLTSGFSKGIGGISGFTDLLIFTLEGLSNIVKVVTDVFDAFFTSMQSGVEKVAGSVSIFQSIKNMLEILGSVGSAVGSTIAKTLESAAKLIGSGFETIIENLDGPMSAFRKWLSDNFTFENVLKAIKTGLLSSLVLSVTSTLGELKSSIGQVSDIIGGIFGGISKNATSFKDSASKINDALKLLSANIRATTILEIAGAVALLAYGMTKISDLDLGQIVKSIAAMSALFLMLQLAMKALLEMVKSLGSTGTFKASLALIAFAVAINILSTAMIKLSKIDFWGAIKGLISIKVLISSLTTFMKKANLSGATTRAAASILALAISVNLLVKPVKELGALDLVTLAKGLGSVAVAMGIMAGAIKLIGKSKMSIKTSLALIAMATAIKIMADPIEQLSALSWEELAKGLSAVAVGLGAMAGTMILISKLKVSNEGFVAAAAILLMAQSLNDIADAIIPLSKISWNGISKGVAGIAGVLAIMSGVMVLLGKLKVSNEGFVAAAAILLMAQSFDDISDAIIPLSKISWNGMAKGVTGIAGVLAIMSGVMVLLSKLKIPKESFVSAAAIVLMAQSLDNIAEAIIPLSKISWDGIWKGISGIGIVLTEMGIVAAAMGKFAGKEGIVGAASLLITVQSLDPIAKAFEKIDGVSWDGIWKGIAGIGIVLTEMGLIAGLLGAFSPVSFLGAASLLIGVQSLDPIAEAFKKIDDVSWDGIWKGITGIGIVLTEMGVITGLLGVFSPASFLGALALTEGVKSLMPLAASLKVFSSMSWEEINNGLKAMSSALSILAGGTLINSLGILGALSIDVVAEPLGVLADSVKKWSSVTLPDNLMQQMAQLAAGVRSFNFTMGGAFSISLLSGGLGGLADSVRKWQGAVVPSNIKESLTGISEGVRSFNWAFMGSWSISQLASPLGELAGSVKKWVGVSVPGGMREALTSISDGVKSFTWLFMAGWSMSTITGPLKDLAGSVTAWKEVSVPPGVEPGLKAISTGLSGFTWLFMSGWSLSTIVGPLKDMASSVTAWNGVTVPPGLKTGLTSIAEGMRSFDGMWGTSGSVDDAVAPVKAMAGSIKAWNGVTVPAGLKAGLTSIAEGMREFDGMWGTAGSVDDAVGPVKSMAGAARSWVGVVIPGNIKTILSNIAGGIRNFDGISGSAEAMASTSGPLRILASSVMMASMIPWAGVATSLVSFSSILGTFNTGAITNIKNVISSAGDLGLSVFAQRIIASIVGITTAMMLLSGALRSGGSSISSSMSYIKGVLNSSTSGMASIVSRNMGVVASVFRVSIGSISAAITSGGSTISGASSRIVAAVMIMAAQIQKSLGRVLSITNSFIPKFSAAGYRLTRALANSLLAGGSIISGASARIVTAVLMMATQIQMNLGRVLSVVNSFVPQFASAGHRLTRALSDALRRGIGDASGSFRGSLNGAVRTINSYRGSFSSAGYNLSSGLASGIYSGRSLAVNAAVWVTRAAVRAVKNEAVIRSPSHVTRKLGTFFSLGLAKGIEDKESTVMDSSAKLISSSKDSIINAMNSVDKSVIRQADASHKMLMDAMGANPIIKPEFDITNVESGANKIQKLLASSDFGYNPIGEINSVKMGVAGISEQKFTDRQAMLSVPKTPISGSNVVLNQYNTSPKSLSRTEIYRDTKNAMSMLKKSISR